MQYCKKKKTTCINYAQVTMKANCLSASLSFQKTRVFLRFMDFFGQFCQILIGKKIYNQLFIYPEAEVPPPFLHSRIKRTPATISRRAATMAIPNAYESQNSDVPLS